jgi:hypothetical protein
MLRKLRCRGVRQSGHAADVYLKQLLQILDQQPSVVPSPIETVGQGAPDLVPLAGALTGQGDQLRSSDGAKRQHRLRKQSDPVISTDGEFALVKRPPESLWLGVLTNHVGMVAHSVPGAFVQFAGYIP